MRGDKMAHIRRCRTRGNLVSHNARSTEANVILIFSIVLAPSFECATRGSCPDDNAARRPRPPLSFAARPVGLYDHPHFSLIRADEQCHALQGGG